MTRSQVYLTCQLSLIFIGWSLQSAVMAQSVRDIMTYSVAPTCDSPDPDKPTNINQYYLELEVSKLTVNQGDFEIIVDRDPILQFHLDSAQIPYSRLVGPFAHSGVGGSYHEYIIRSLDDDIADTLYLPEVVCGRSTNNGLDHAGYYCDRGNFGVVAQVKPEKLEVPEMPEKTYVYVLIQRSTGLVTDRNFSGHFSAVTDLTDYEVHAFAIPFEMQAEFINNIVIGNSLDQDDLNICYGLCGVYQVFVDCSSFDLSLTKIVDGGFVYSVGDIVIFNISVHNDGRVTAYNIVVEDYMPDALDFIPEFSPHWGPDLRSYPIDSLEAGQSIILPIYMRVNRSSPLIEIVNIAEIVFAADNPSTDVPAFDVDSTPDNENGNEDDRDDEEIIILENLCAATFDIDAANEPVCKGQPLVLMADIRMASFPILYRWRLNGQIVSRDSIYTIENHSAGNYGNYSLTIIDNNGCTGTEYFTIEPILNDERFSCYTNINVGVNSDCEVFLTPDMFTSRSVSGIKDYIIEVRDEDNNIVDLSDLSAYQNGTILEALIINPCTFETICWSNLLIERKSLPEVDLYDEDTFVTMCPEVNASDPTAIIREYNQTHTEIIYNAGEYTEKLNGVSCLGQWDVNISDEFSPASDACSARLIHRIYFIYDQEQKLPIDTATLVVQPIMADSIVMPEDVHNILCSDGLTPEDLNSFPSYFYNGMEHSFKGSFFNQNESFCNIGIRYTDQEFGGSCNLGASKIIRRWTATDWCSDTFSEDFQYLFIIDHEGPQLSSSQELFHIETAPFACFAIIDIYDYLDVRDLCDPHPEIKVNGFVNPRHIELQIGHHSLDITARDRCGNSSEILMDFNIAEQTPPIAILNENISISLSTESNEGTNYITAESIDAGSHDFDCGPVQLSFARHSEILLIESQGGSVNHEFDLKNCDTDLVQNDLNENGLIERHEIFRDRIYFCCQDIGTDVRLIVRVTDQSKNISEAQVTITVDAKSEWDSCDDGDPCTIDDRSYGDCPCSGRPFIEDFDNDNIIDCTDESLTICLNGDQLDISPDSIDAYLAKGAIGGPCHEEGLMASIAGEIFTNYGDLIENVVVSVNYQKEDMTAADGYYRFDGNEMYQRYELYPERDEDPLNGVTTLDLVILQEFILGFRKIEDPYLLIAADVNNDGRVSALDIVELRKLLLGITDKISNNKSWRFVIEEFEFDDIRNPYDFQEINVISNLDNDKMDENWIGIKIGDLNNTVQANSLKSNIRSSQEWSIVMPDVAVQKGDEIKIPITGSEEKSLLGLQLGFEFEGLSFVSLTSGDIKISPEQYAIHEKRTDRLSIAWHSEEKINVREKLFYLTLYAESDGKLSDMISLDHHPLKPLAGFDDYLDVEVGLLFSKGIDLDVTPSASLYQNQPNPFNGETIIQFYIPGDEDVTMSFYSSNGELLFSISDNYTAGINAIRLTHSDLSLFEGLVYYQMSYQGQLLSRKMVIAR